MTVSIVVPVLDDGRRLRRLLEDLERYWPARAAAESSARRAGATLPAGPEIIVVDGGSRDDSVEVARRAGVRVLERRRGRGLQLHEGARAASRPWLWFLHADSGVSAQVLDEMDRLSKRAPCWGRFDVRLANTPLLKLIAAAMNWRSALTGICTGDQGIFVHRNLLEAAGGIPRQPLMEDVELSRRLRRHGRPLRLRGPIEACSRRWRTQGVLKTMILMWWLRLRYFCGARAEDLDRVYHG